MGKVKDESEVISADEVKVLPPEIEKEISAEIAVVLKEHNLTQEAIESLKERYSGLTIKGPDDKEGYVLVQESRKNLKAIRVGIQKAFKKLREIDNLKIKRKITAEKGLVEQVSELEDPLYEQEKAYDANKEKEKAAKAQKMDQQGIQRTSEMMGFGARLEAGNWILGDLSYESVLIKNCDEDIYEGMRDQFKAIFDVNEKAKAEEAEKTRLANEKLLKDQEDLKRMQKEAKDMRTQGRISFLESLGMNRSRTGDSYISADQIVLVMDIKEKESQDWEVIIVGVREGIERAQASAKEEERVEEVFRKRLILLREWSSDGRYINGSFTQGKNWGTVKQLVDLPEKEFDNLIGQNETFLHDRDEKIKQQQQQQIENARLEGIGKYRRQSLTAIQGGINATDIELGEMDELIWGDYYAGVKFNWDAAQKVVADQKEKERLSLLGEKAQYEELVAKLKAIFVPVLKSGQYAGKATAIRTFINNL